MGRSLTGSAAFVLFTTAAAAQDNAEATTDAAPKPPPPVKGIEWTVGELKVRLGGYVKVDLIHDFNAIGSTQSFDPRTIPTHSDPTLPDQNTEIHARQTRLNLDVSGPSSVGDVRLFVEVDFFGSDGGNALRMRHAFGTIGVASGTLLAGQTWSTFVDEKAFPETLDFESPVAFPQNRQAQARFTKDLGNGNYMAVAIEDPTGSGDIIAPGVGAVETTLPDINGRFFLETDRGHVQAGLFLGHVGFDPAVGSSSDELLWGLNVSTRMTTVGDDNAIFQVTYGDGVGRYRSGVTAAPDSSGDIEAVEVLGIVAAYQHFWDDKWRSNAGFSWASADLPSGAPATAIEEVDNLFVNLIYQVSERVWTGVEYMHGSVETEDGAYGGAHRLQASIQFDI